MTQYYCYYYTYFILQRCKISSTNYFFYIIYYMSLFFLSLSHLIFCFISNYVTYYLFFFLFLLFLTVNKKFDCSLLFLFPFSISPAYSLINYLSFFLSFCFLSLNSSNTQKMLLISVLLRIFHNQYLLF
jgi:hypothetical protein